MQFLFLSPRIAHIPEFLLEMFDFVKSLFNFGSSKGEDVEEAAEVPESPEVRPQFEFPLLCPSLLLPVGEVQLFRQCSFSKLQICDGEAWSAKWEARLLPTVSTSTTSKVFLPKWSQTQTCSPLHELVRSISNFIISIFQDSILRRRKEVSQDLRVRRGGRSWRRLLCLRRRWRGHYRTARV